MRSSKDFQRTTRRGVRVGRPTLVGFVVSGAVGNAVIRNRVKRRLRHLAAARVAGTPAGVDIVVRALPRAATDPARVPIDFESAWQDAVARLTTPRPERAGDAR